MSKILCVDIGNTNTKFAVVGDGFYEYLGFVPTGDRRIISAPTCDGCIISSVVPSFTGEIAELVRGEIGIEPKFVPTDRGVGADLYASMEYAKKHFTLPCAVFSLGTATTVYVLDEKGEMQGGMIIPGMMTAVNALADKTFNLPNIVPEKTNKFLEFSTIEAMNSGIIYSSACAIDGICSRFKKEYGCRLFVLSGGMSELMDEYVETEHIVERDIVLKGAFELYKKTSA